MNPPPEKLMNRNFVLLWQGQLVSAIGSQAFTVAMMFWVKHATGSATLMGVMMMVSMLPLVVLSPFGGTLADRFSRRGIIITCDLVSGVTVLLLATIMFAAPERTSLIIACLFVVSAVQGVVSSAFHPAIKAAIPSIVPESKVAAANSMNEGSFQVATLAGQAAGGILFRILGAPLLILFDGITYLVSAVSESFARIPQTFPEKGGEWRAELRHFRADLVAGLRFVWERDGLRTLILAAAVLNFFAMPFVVLLPFFVEDHLGATTDWYGYLLAAMGGGGIIGYVFSGSVKMRGSVRGPVLIFFLLALSALIGLLGFVEGTALALVVMLVAGFFQGAFHISTITLLQLSTPEEMRGRVFGLLHTLAMGLTPLSMGLTGIVADALDQNAPLIFKWCGAILVVCTLAAASRRAFREFLSA